MAIDYTYFQSSPCDYDTYKYIMDGNVPESWDVKDNETVLRATTLRIENDGTLVGLATTLPVVDYILYGNIVPVYILNELNITDSFDPTNTTIPEPTMTCSFVLDNSLNIYPDDEIKNRLNSLENSQITIHKYFVKCDLSDLRNELGVFKHSVLDNNYFKPVASDESRGTPAKRESVFGEYVVTDVSYNYKTKVVTLQADLLAYEIMKNVLAFNKDTCLLPQYCSFTSNSKTPNKYLTCFEPLFEVMYPTDSRCEYVHTLTKDERLESHLDFNQLLALSTNAEFPRVSSDDLFDYYPNRLNPDADKPIINTFKRIGNYQFYPLYSYLANTTYLDCIRESALMNDLFLLPTNSTYDNAEVNENLPMKNITLPRMLGNGAGVNFQPNPDGSYTVTGTAGGRVDPVAMTHLNVQPGEYYISADGGVSDFIEFEVVPVKNNEPDFIRSVSVCCGEHKTITIGRYEYCDIFIRAGRKDDRTPRNSTITPIVSKLKIGAEKATWRIVGGKKPNKHVFPAKKQNFIASNNLGKYYETTDEIYLISERAILSQSDTKQTITLNDIVSTTTSDIKILEDFQVEDKDGARLIKATGVSTESFDLIEQPTNNDDVLTPNGHLKYEKSKYDNKSFETITLPSQNSTVLPEGAWFDVKSDSGSLNGNNGDALCFSSDVISFKSDSNLTVEANLLRGRTLLNPIGLYNPKLKIRTSNFYIENLDAHKPFSVSLRKVAPNKNKLNRNAQSIADSDKNNASLDTKFISTVKHKSALPTILDRVNAVNMKPLYGLEWTMLDDPFLRIGTLVYYPFQGYYVTVLITEQTRTTSNGDRLQCKGWVLEETNIPTPTPDDDLFAHSNEVLAQPTVLPLMHNHWLRG